MKKINTDEHMYKKFSSRWTHNGPNRVPTDEHLRFARNEPNRVPPDEYLRFASYEPDWIPPDERLRFHANGPDWIPRNEHLGFGSNGHDWIPPDDHLRFGPNGHDWMPPDEHQRFANNGPAWIPPDAQPRFSPPPWTHRERQVRRDSHRPMIHPRSRGKSSTRCNLEDLKVTVDSHRPVIRPHSGGKSIRTHSNLVNLNVKIDSHADSGGKSILPRSNLDDLKVKRDSHRPIIHPDSGGKSSTRSNLLDLVNSDQMKRRTRCRAKRKKKPDYKNTSDTKENKINSRVDVKINLLSRENRIKGRNSVDTSIEGSNEIVKNRIGDIEPKKNIKEDQDLYTDNSLSTNADTISNKITDESKEEITIHLTTENPVLKEKISDQDNEIESVDTQVASSQNKIDFTEETEIKISDDNTQEQYKTDEHCINSITIKEQKVLDTNIADAELRESNSSSCNVSTLKQNANEEINDETSDDVFEAATEEIRLDSEEISHVSNQTENINVKINETADDDLFEASTQEIRLDSEQILCYVSNQGGNENDTISETSAEFFEVSSQEIKLKSENFLSDTIPIEDVDIPYIIENSKLDDKLVQNENRVDQISIPFLENLLGETTDSGVSLDRTDDPKQTQTNLTPEKYLYYCESIENNHDKISNEENTVRLDMNDPQNVSNILHSVAASSSKRKSEYKVEKSAKKKRKGDSYPEINVGGILEEINSILGNSNTSKSEKEQICLNSNSSRSNEPKQNVSGKSHLAAHIVIKNDTVLKKQLKKKEGAKDMQKNDTNEQFQKKKNVICKREFVNNATSKGNEKDRNKDRFREKSDRSNIRRDKKAHSNKREDCSKKNSDVHEPYLKKFRDLFGEDENDNEDIRRLEKSLKLGKDMKKMFCHKTSSKISNLKTKIVTKDEVKKMHRKSSKKKIVDTKKNPSKRTEPRVADIRVVLEDCCKSLKSSGNNRFKNCSLMSKETNRNHQHNAKINRTLNDIETTKEGSYHNIDIGKGNSLKLKYGIQTEIVYSSCSVIQFQSFSRAIIGLAEDYLCYMAVTLDKVDIQELVVVVPNIENVKSDVEIPLDISTVALLDKNSISKEDSKDELLTILKEELEPINSETVTLYRSEETINPNLEVQAHSAIIGDINNSKRVSPDYANEDKRFSELDEKRSDAIESVIQMNVNRKSEDSQNIATSPKCDSVNLGLDDNQNTMKPNSISEFQNSQNSHLQETTSESNISAISNVTFIQSSNRNFPNITTSLNNETQIPSLVHCQSYQINMNPEPSSNGCTDTSQIAIRVISSIPVISGIPASDAMPTPIRQHGCRANVENNPEQSPRHVVCHENNTDFHNVSLPTKSLVQNTDVSKSINNENHQNWPVSPMQPSNEKNTGSTQTLRKELAENFNTSVNYDSKIMLNQITKKFSEIIVFYIHVVQHHRIYLNSIKGLTWYAPDLVKLEEDTAVAQLRQKLAFLSKRLLTDLQMICDKRNIDLEANKWFEDVFQNAHSFSPTFTKGQLFYLLYQLMRDQSEYYLTIPYLRTIFNIVKTTVRTIEIRQQSALGMTEKQRKILKKQIEQYRRIISAMPHRLTEAKSPGENASTGFTVMPTLVNAAHLTPTVSSIQARTRQCSPKVFKTNGHPAPAPSQSGKVQNSTNDYIFQSRFASMNNCKPHFQLQKNIPNIMPKTSLPMNHGTVNIQNPQGLQSMCAMRTKNPPLLKILSDVVINPGSHNKPTIQNVQDADNYKIALPLSKPYDMQYPVNSTENNILSKGTNGSRLTALCRNTENQVNFSQHSGKTPNMHNIRSNISQHTTSSNNGEQSTISGSFLNYIGNDHNSNNDSTASGIIFKAPNPVYQERTNYSYINNRKSEINSPAYVNLDISNETSLGKQASPEIMETNSPCLPNINNYTSQDVSKKLQEVPEVISRAPLDLAGMTPRYSLNNNSSFSRQPENVKQIPERTNEKSIHHIETSSKSASLYSEPKPQTLPENVISSKNKSVSEADLNHTSSKSTPRSDLTPLSQTGSTPDHTVPPALRNLKSPVYAPMLFSPPSYMDDCEEAELSCTPENEIIDLTWMEDADPQQLEKEIIEFYLKKEEPDDDEVVLNKEQFPVSDYNALTFVDRLCICNHPAIYVCQCRLVMYCSELCQRQDWKEHKHQCLKARVQETDRN